VEILNGCEEDLVEGLKPCNEVVGALVSEVCSDFECCEAESEQFFSIRSETDREESNLSVNQIIYID